MVAKRWMVDRLKQRAVEVRQDGFALPIFRDVRLRGMPVGVVVVKTLADVGVVSIAGEHKPGAAWAPDLPEITGS